MNFFFESRRGHDVRCDYLVEDLNVVVGQVEENQTTQATESSLLHPADVTALQREMSQVGSVFESPSGKFLDVITSKIQFHCDLRRQGGYNTGTTVHLLQGHFCVWMCNLINRWRNFCQVLVDAGHRELDLVTDALLGTFSCKCCRNAEEQKAEQWDPEDVGTELGVHLRGKVTSVTLTAFCM